MWLLLAHGARNRNRTLVISISFSLSNAQIFSQICSQFLTNWLSLFRGPGKTFRVEMQNIFFCKLEPHHALNVSRHFPAPGPYWHSRMWLKCPPRPRTPREAASATSSVKPSIISKLGVISPQPLHPHLTYGNDHFLCFITYYISHPYPFCQCLSRIRFFH